MPARGSSTDPPVVVRMVHTMGTVVSVQVRRGPIAGGEAPPGVGGGSSTSALVLAASDGGRGGVDGPVDPAVAEVAALLTRADRIFSTWDPWSAMSRLRRGALVTADVAPDVRHDIDAVLELAAELRAATAGWFDPWALPGGVDPTGVVKGWAAQRAADVLADQRLPALVNAGGDVVASRVAGASPWRVGVRHPWRPGALACVALVGGTHQALATSGAYERGAHLFDPRSGRRTRGAVASASVAGPDLAVADAAATAVAVGGRPAADQVGSALGSLGYAVYLIGHGGDEWWTEDFPFADDPAMRG